jgi:hypothetical protein
MQEVVIRFHPMLLRMPVRAKKAVAVLVKASL